MLTAESVVLASRHFNQVIADPVRGTVTKISTDRSKLRDEFDWYQALPGNLRPLVPRVRAWHDDGRHAYLVMDYSPHPCLGTLHAKGDTDSASWTAILGSLLDVHESFRRHRGAVIPGDVEAMYVDKTAYRLAQLASSDEKWRRLLARDKIACNGVLLSNVTALSPTIQRRAKDLARSVQGSIIHGDFCLSNILADLDKQVFRVVDPRGRFGRKGTHGDPRYDAAKLRHSCAGGYELIVADRFTVMVEPHGLTGYLHRDRATDHVAQACDRFLTNAGYDLAEIRFIDALLFLSMIPLHSDSPARQAMMYLTGLTLLNEVIA